MKASLRTKVWWPKCDKNAENIYVAIDLMGPLPSNDYIFVVVDYFSMYKEVKICRTITSTVIVEHLKEIFTRLGNPVSITADNGSQFTSTEFKEFCSVQNIRVYNTIPYWPQQNGEVERQNRDILKRLKISQVEKKNWKEALREYMIM